MEKHFEVYGIAGKKYHGKDTLAQFIVKHNPEFKILHFADRLKQICIEIFGITHEQAYDSKLKEIPLDRAIYIDDYLDALKAVTGLEILPRDITVSTPRALLQVVGTEYVRSICDTYWVDYVLNQVKQGGKFLIPDTRFPNEAEAIVGLDGWLIKINRPELEATEGSAHASETEIDQINSHCVVVNKSLENIEAFAKMVADGKFPRYWREQVAADELKILIEGFNIAFRNWESMHGVGANVGINYDPKTGRKSWKVLDVSQEIAERPGVSVLAAAANALQQAAASGELERAFGSLTPEQAKEIIGGSASVVGGNEGAAPEASS